VKKTASGKKEFRMGDDETLRAFRRALGEVGRNLPRDLGEVEGSDVAHVIRHKDGKVTEGNAISEALSEPHADAERELVDEMDL
jgi:hypothetical protein